MDRKWMAHIRPRLNFPFNIFILVFLSSINEMVATQHLPLLLIQILVSFRDTLTDIPEIMVDINWTSVSSIMYIEKVNSQRLLIKYQLFKIVTSGAFSPSTCYMYQVHARTCYTLTFLQQGLSSSSLPALTTVIQNLFIRIDFPEQF